MCSKNVHIFQQYFSSSPYRNCKHLKKLDHFAPMCNRVTQPMSTLVVNSLAVIKWHKIRSIQLRNCLEKCWLLTNKLFILNLSEEAMKENPSIFHNTSLTIFLRINFIIRALFQHRTWCNELKQMKNGRRLNFALKKTNQWSVRSNDITVKMFPFGCTEQITILAHFCYSCKAGILW
jgi:hypothetical protein